MKRSNSTRPPTRKDPTRYPKGLNRKKVEALISFYENQTDDQAIAEAEAAYGKNSMTMMAVPNELVPTVQKLIARRAG